MTLHSLKTFGVSALCASLLAACGGGGGDAPPAPPGPPGGTSFAMRDAYRSRIATGATDNFNVSGSCAGTATFSTVGATPSTFEGVTGFSARQDSTTNFTICAPASSTVTGTTHYDGNLLPIGLAIDGGEYSRFAAAPTAIPALVKVGDSAVIATLTTYADSGKLVVLGQRVVSYTIETDSATTAIANIITRAFDQGNRVLSTQQSRFRMAENGGLTLLSIDVQFSTTSTLHLVYTPR